MEGPTFDRITWILDAKNVLVIPENDSEVCDDFGQFHRDIEILVFVSFETIKI